MIEVIICNYLSEKLGCRVLPERPSRPFGRMVFVERTSGRGRYIKETTIAIQSYEESMYKAAELNDAVIAAMETIAEDTSEEVNETITGCELNSNYNYTDTTTKEYRYQAVFTVYHY